MLHYKKKQQIIKIKKSNILLNKKKLNNQLIEDKN